MGDEGERLRAIMLLDKIPADCDPEYISKSVDLIVAFARQVARETLIVQADNLRADYLHLEKKRGKPYKSWGHGVMDGKIAGLRDIESSLRQQAKEGA